MPKKINYSELIKETLILTVAVAVIAARCFLFSSAKPCIRQQYFRSWNRSVELHSFAAFCDHNDFKRGTSNYRLSYLRKRIRN